MQITILRFERAQKRNVFQATTYFRLKSYQILGGSLECSESKRPIDPSAHSGCCSPLAEGCGRREFTRSIRVAKRLARGPRLRSRVPPSFEGQLNAFLAQKYPSEPLMIGEPEISL